MKKTKLALVLAVMFFIKTSQSQVAIPVVDASVQMAVQKGNASLTSIVQSETKQMAKMVEQINKYKQMAHIAKNTMKQNKQTADAMTAILNENYTTEGLSELKFNKDFKGFVESVLCIKFEDYIPDNSAFLKIIVSFKASVGECSNFNFYLGSNAGLTYKNASGYYTGGVAPEKMNYKQTVESIRKMGNDGREAKVQQNAVNLMHDRTMLEVGFKMIEIGEEITKYAEELKNVLNIEKEQIKGIDLDQFGSSMSQFEALVQKAKKLQAINTAFSSNSPGGAMLNGKINEMVSQGEDTGESFGGFGTEGEVMSLGDDTKSTVGTNKKDGAIDMTRAQRLELILKCNDYIMKGLEYKQQGLELIARANNSKYAKDDYNSSLLNLEYKNMSEAYSKIFSY